MPIYLYIKTHNLTGLKYLGKTSNADPHKYPGSGKHWRRHLDRHGYDYTTDILAECENNEEVKILGQHYSSMWDVVNSEQWANLKPEAGDGGDTSMTDGFKQGMLLNSENNKRRRWYNDGVNQIFSETCPDGYVRGRLSFNNIGAKLGAKIQTGKRWYNNSVEEGMFIPGDQPTSWQDGRLPSPIRGQKKPEWSESAKRSWDTRRRNGNVLTAHQKAWNTRRIKSNVPVIDQPTTSC